MTKIRLAAFADEAGNSVKEQISALKKVGVLGVELRSIDKINVADFSVAQSKEYYKAFADAGIFVWSIGSPLGKVDINVNFTEYLEKAKRVFEIANIFNTDKIRSFSFFNAYGERSKVIDYLSALVETAKSFGVYLCHENEKEIYGDTAERVCDLMQSVKGLKFVYDPANYIQVGEPADKTLSLFHSKTEYFHITDVIAATDELVPAGYGDGNIDKLVNMIDRDVTLTLEPHLAVFDAFKSIDNTEMKHKFHFKDNFEAFAFATDALKNILIKNGYTEKDGCFFKGE
ncbi:MAG: TIM barrel protein [Clostridia bacterium]|nr:TIM barrel protein [Clostridia bacterium]